MKLTKTLLAATLLLGLGACSNSTEPAESEKEVLNEVDQDELDKEVGTEEAEEIDAETTQGDKYDGTVGDMLTFNNVSITLGAVSYENPETVSSIPEGYELVICSMEVINDTDETLTFDMNLFSMENNEGDTVAPQGYEVDGSRDLIDGVTEVKAGEAMTFRLSFEEPEGSSPLILYYLKDTTNNDEQTLTWTIDR